MNIQPILKLAVGASLYNALEAYRVTDDALMPEEYRAGHRPLHDDWFMFKTATRMETARRVPLPFDIIEGEFKWEWLLFDPAYPLSPGMESKVVDGLMYVKTKRAGYGLVKYAAFISGEWRPCFTKYTKRHVIFGKVYRHSWYVGLHQDNHVSPPHATKDGKIRSDLMGWIEPFAMSFRPEQ